LAKDEVDLPRFRNHRRSIASQMLPKSFIGSSIGLSHKKERAPALLQLSEDPSDESSSGDSPWNWAGSSTALAPNLTKKVFSVEREIGNATLLGKPSPGAGPDTPGGGSPFSPISTSAFKAPKKPSLSGYKAARIKQGKLSLSSEAAQAVQRPPKLNDNITASQPQLPSAAHNALVLSDTGLETNVSRPRRKLLRAAEYRAEKKKRK